jgi:hypothetical protein
MMETECIDRGQFYEFLLKFHDDALAVLEMEKQVEYFDVLLFLLDYTLLHFRERPENRKGDPLRDFCAYFLAIAADHYPDLLRDGKKTEYVSRIDEHLKSPGWKILRVAKLKEAGFRCQVCNSSENLHVCHRNWSRLFHEELDDLVVLCKSCHDLFRANKKLAKRPEGYLYIVDGSF